MGTATDYEQKQKQRQGQAFARFCISGPREPWEPQATRAEVLAIPCSTCRAVPGAECVTDSLRPSFLGAAFPDLRGIHTRRYLDLTNDPR